MKFKISIILILSILSFSLFYSCKKDKLTPDEEVNQFVYEAMSYWYLWNDFVPPIFDPTAYTTPQDAMDALAYTKYDKWSFVITMEEYNSYFTAGEYVGIGVKFKYDLDDSLRIAFVFNESDAYEKGLRRGDIILKINNKDILEITDVSGEISDEIGGSTSFSVRKSTGDVVSANVITGTVNINTVLHSEVIDVDGDKVGYLVFNSFVEKSFEELDSAFSLFERNNVSDLILDLRYNGGGMTSVAQHLANMIAPASAIGNTFTKYTYNADRRAEADTTVLLSNANYALNLNRVFVISTGSTASASELIINGLSPYMEVLLVGSDTHGKPVGMNGFQYGGYAIFPITFRTVNVNNEGDYFEGIPVDTYCPDDLSRNFGDTLEYCLNESIYYIQNGSFSNQYIKSAGFNQEIVLTGFQREIGAF